VVGGAEASVSEEDGSGTELEEARCQSQRKLAERAAPAFERVHGAVVQGTQEF
jgi:hypothetical protein